MRDQQSVRHGVTMTAVSQSATTEPLLSPRWFEAVRQHLHDQFGPSLPTETIDRCFMAELERFAAARITAFLPILVRRGAADRLSAMQGTRASLSTVPTGGE